NELEKNESLTLSEEDVCRTMPAVHRQVRGAYAVVAMILGHGMVAFRDPWGIRPLALGKRDTEDGEEYIVASESVAIDGTGFKYVRDVEPGEA
ncbi:amidophosphoribosyltransferase, partial [Pseudoalteromonas sp. SIMBA_153]